MVFQPTITVVVHLDRMQRFSRLLHAGLRGPGVGIIDEMFNQWSHRYSAFIRERFANASRGDGTWPPLAPVTLYARSRAPIARVYRAFRAGEITEAERDKKLKAARRSQKKLLSQNVAILRDTGTLFNALTIGAVGNVNRRQGPYQIYGIGGPVPHPGGHATIGRIAAYHNAGGTIPGRPPQRRILVPPLPAVVQGMRADAMRAARRLLAMGG